MLPAMSEAAARALGTLGYVVLGQLARGPRTGYDLARELRSPVGLFWTASQGQIHPVLVALADAGLAEFSVERGPGPNDRKVYRITERGLGALSAWVAQPPRPRDAKDELLVKTWSAWTGDRDGVAEMVERERRRHLEQLAYLEDRQREYEERHGGREPPVDSRDFFELATVRRGIGYERDYAQWCEWLAARLRSGNDYMSD
jgi:DNA-binding PadR family transcriptional regulator